MKILLIVLLTLCSLVSPAQTDIWIYLTPDDQDYAVMFNRVTSGSHMMLLSFKVQNATIKPSMNFGTDEVNSVNTVKVEFQPGNRHSTIPVRVGQEHLTMDITLQRDLDLFMKVLKTSTSVTFTIIYAKDGPVKYVVPLDKANWSFLYE